MVELLSIPDHPLLYLTPMTIIQTPTSKHPSQQNIWARAASPPTLFETIRALIFGHVRWISLVRTSPFVSAMDAEDPRTATFLAHWMPTVRGYIRSLVARPCSLHPSRRGAAVRSRGLLQPSCLLLIRLFVVAGNTHQVIFNCSLILCIQANEGIPNNRCLHEFIQTASCTVQSSKWDGMKWYAIPGLPLAGTGMVISIPAVPAPLFSQFEPCLYRRLECRQTWLTDQGWRAGQILSGIAQSAIPLNGAALSKYLFIQCHYSAKTNGSETIVDAYIRLFICHSSSPWRLYAI